MNIKCTQNIYKSANGVSNVTYYIMVPEQAEVRGIVQLCHSMCEYFSRYTAFANAEAFLIKHAIVIPFHRQADNGYVVSDLSVFDRPFSPFGVSSYRYEGAHLLDTPISMDEYYAQYEQWETDRQAALEAAAAES